MISYKLLTTNTLNVDLEKKRSNFIDQELGNRIKRNLGYQVPLPTNEIGDEPISLGGEGMKIISPSNTTDL